MSVLLDTHAAVWHLLDAAQLSADARQVIDATADRGEPVCMASISLVEIVYLVEKSRLPETALERLNAALSDPNPGIILVALDAAVAQRVRQVPREFVPDMPDRIIVATALHLGMPLVTRDRQIRSGGVETIW